MTRRIVVGMPIINSVPAEAYLSQVALICEIYRTCSLKGEGGFAEELEKPTLHIETPINKFPHDIARSQIMNVAIKGDFDYLFFMDSDMVFPTIAFSELLRVLEETKVAVVSGHYYRRGHPYTCVWSRMEGGQAFNVDSDTGIYEIDFSGLGCALIDVRWVRANLKPPFFTMGVGEMCSEVKDDVSFFEKVKTAGGKVLGHAGIRCGHLGGQVMICDENVEELRRLFLGKEKKTKVKGQV